MALAAALADPTREYRLPLAFSLGLHVLVVLTLSLNLSWCSSDVKLPPVPAHIKAVVIDRPLPYSAPAPQAAPEPAPAPPPPEPVSVPKKPEPEKPQPRKPLPKPAPKKPEPKKPVPKPAKPEPRKPEPKKPEPRKPEPKKPEPKKPVAPDFDALMDREDRSLAAQDAQRKAASEQAAKDAAERDAATARVVAEYKQKILDVLRQRWNRPPSARNGMSVTLSVSLIPGGEVVSTPVIVKSSGDAAFDRSAQNAVLLASPLPVPSDPAIFNASFRKFTFVARPEDLKQ